MTSHKFKCILGGIHLAECDQCPGKARDQSGVLKAHFLSDSRQFVSPVVASSSQVLENIIEQAENRKTVLARNEVEVAFLYVPALRCIESSYTGSV